MSIGIFVTSLNPSSPSQAHLQRAVLSGLATVGAGRYRFIVFSYDPAPVALDGGMVHQPIAKYGKWGAILRRLGAKLAKGLWRAWELTGASGGRTWNFLARLSRFEPKHFQQMRDLDIRLLWNMNQHELKVPVPFMRTIWEANHRIHPMFPEYSYAGYGYDRLDAGMADSLARASYVITGTEEGKRQLVDMFGVYAAKVRVLPFPTPTLPASGAPRAERRPYVLYPARFWPLKNHVVILEALKILRTEHGLDMAGVFTGADMGNLGYVLKYAERLGVRDLVDYRHVVSDEELADLYQSAFALVYASAVGPDNLPPLEAMAFGCPVIAADVPGAREQYDAAAIYFAPTDEKELAERVLRLTRDNDLRKTLIASGKVRAAGLTAKNYAAGVVAILDEFAKVARAWERCDSAIT